MCHSQANGVNSYFVVTFCYQFTNQSVTTAQGAHGYLQRTAGDLPAPAVEPFMFVLPQQKLNSETKPLSPLNTSKHFAIYLEPEEMQQEKTKAQKHLLIIPFPDN